MSNMLRFLLYNNEKTIKNSHEILDRQNIPLAYPGEKDRLSLTERLKLLVEAKTLESRRISESLYQTISDAHTLLDEHKVPKAIWVDCENGETMYLKERMKYMIDLYEGELNTVYQEKSNAHEVGAKMYLDKCKEVAKLTEEVDQLTQEKATANQIASDLHIKLDEAETINRELRTNYNKLLDLLT